MGKSIYDELQVNNKEKVYIHNEIFEDLAGNPHFSAKNVVFVYAYYCIISYLYRHCKYGIKLFSGEDIKEMLGYQRKYGGVDYLIKKGGVLDHIRWTDNMRDYPISYKREDGYLDFQMYSQQSSDLRGMLGDIPRRYYIKKPLSAFYRTEDSREDNVYDGTFYDISNTHLFDMSLFVEMMRRGLSIGEFFMYQFFRHKNDKFKDGYNASYEQIEKEVKIPKRTLVRIVLKLEESGYLEAKRDRWSEEGRNPNVYMAKR